MPAIEIVDVNPSNVDELGFFCCMSKPDSAGHQEKLAWVKERFSEGLRIKVIERGGRGFIEYMPGKMAWRGIDAPQYMVIHCLWVVGRVKGKGSGKALLDGCLGDARDAKMHGVAVVAARGKVGFVDTDFFLRHGFHVVESTASGMDLVALKFNPSNADPHFTHDLKKKAKALGDGLTVVSSPQCPYTYEGAQQIVSLAHAEKIPVLSLRVNTLAQLRQTSPSPYASFDVVYSGEVISNLFHCMTARKLRKLVSGAAARSGASR
jgi:N-acetylglutamate synthase-like GNAT family acetyltransferase